MTPNGGVVFAAVLIVAAVLAGPSGLVILAAAAATFATLEVGGASCLAALRRALLVMVPLAAFMLIVWVGVVGRAPQEIAAGAAGSRQAALVYVATVAGRLFLIVWVVQLVGLRFADQTVLGFVRMLRTPVAAKRLMVLTLSLVETLRHSVDRAHTALIAGGILTRGWSLRNLANGWILMQTIWLTAVTTVTARIRDKWPVEDTVALLDHALTGGRARLSPGDVGWIAGALAAGLASQIVGWHVAA